MAGKTTYLGANPNDFTWAIPKTADSGNRFERLIERYLKLHVAGRDMRIRILPTRRVGDEGRDFEVSFTGTAKMFGFTIAAVTVNTRARAFVECKSTADDQLDDAFLADAGQHKDNDAVAYILVTNAVVTPYCQWRAQREWDRRGARFCLVDRRRLFDLVQGHGLATEAARLGIPLPVSPCLPPLDPQALVVSCQVARHSQPTSRKVSVYVSLRNHGDASVLTDLDLATDVSWSVVDGAYRRSVSPGMLETIELIAQRQEIAGTKELGLHLTVNGRSTRLSISHPRFDVALDPPFTGETHRQLAVDLRKRIQRAAQFLLVSLRGDAGVGKTRTVREALDPLINSGYLGFTYNFTRDGLPDLADFKREVGFIGGEDLLNDEQRLGALLHSAAASGVPIILHLEDLHHAEDDVIAVLKRTILNPPECASPLVVIISGRDDHTFPNECYYSMLQLVEQENGENVCAYRLAPLTDDDARRLVKEVVVNMPEPGVDRVHRLGQNNPFIIVEVLQYLLDVHLAQLLSRRTVGILNPELFASREGLPESVGQLYDLRLASLRNAPHGDLAANFLVISSFFGLAINDDVRTSFFDGREESESCWSLLCARRFIRDEGAGSQACFAHENLLHHLRRWSREPDNCRFASGLVLSRPGLVKRLRLLDLGEAYFMHGEYATALACFDAPRKRIAKVTNFSSEEIDRSYFPYLPALFHCGLAEKQPVELLANVALAYAYMGVHNFPLVSAENACKTSLELLDAIFADKDQGKRQRLAVRQLRAHAMQNMGHTTRALQEMLEIEAELRSCQPWPELAFDLHDRLAEYYRKVNHSALMDAHDNLAGCAVRETHDCKLNAAHRITHASARIFGGEVTARKRAAAAHKAAIKSGVKRFVTYTRLTELVIDTLYSRGEVEVLSKVASEARTMLRDAALECYADSIMRLELLLGTISLHTATDPCEGQRLARAYSESGQANSVRFGNGLFDWAFDNLAAVTDIEDQTRDDDHVRARFESCLERLRRRGLAFLGAGGGTYPNAFAVSNIVRWFGSRQESYGVKILQRSISAYDDQFAWDIYRAQELVRRAVNGRPIFWPAGKSAAPMLRYPAETGYFTPVF